MHATVAHIMNQNSFTVYKIHPYEYTPKNDFFVRNVVDHHKGKNSCSLVGK